jgi:hypothetical protein
MRDVSTACDATTRGTAVSGSCNVAPRHWSQRFSDILRLVRTTSDGFKREVVSRAAIGLAVSRCVMDLAGRLRLALVLCLVACRAHPPDNVYACETRSDCPQGQVCGRDGLCRRPASVQTDERDVSAALDAAIPDGAIPVASRPAQDASSAPTQPMAGTNAGSSGAPNAGAGVGGSSEQASAGSAGSGTAGHTAPAPGFSFGQTCTADAECSSSQCVKGRCCAVRQCGICQQCGADGQCQMIVNAVDPYDCEDQGTHMCDAHGHCARLAGQTCGSELDCVSAACDGHCCARTCNTCENCTENANNCSPVNFTEDPDTCTGPRTCSSGKCLYVDIDQTAHRNESQPILSLNESLAQTITVASAGTLAEVRVHWICGSSEVSLQRVAADGTPSGQLAAMVSVEKSGDFNLMTSIVVSPGLKVAAGDRVAVVIKAKSTSTDPVDACRAYASIGDRYTAGQAFLWTPSNPTWTAQTGIDLNFKLILSL